MIVIRMETVGSPKEGRGWEKAYSYSSHWSALPTPQMEGIIKYAHDMYPYVCGCVTLKQFHLWWKKKHFKTIPFSKLKGAPRIVILDVPESEALIGKKQCIFKRHKARVIGGMDSKGNIVWKNTKLRHSSTTEKGEFSQSDKTRTSKPTRFKPIMLN